MSGQGQQLVLLRAKLARECGQQVMEALNDPRVTEINLNPDGTLWLDIAGKGMERVGEMAAHNAESILATCATLLDTVITKESPILEGEFPLDGSRLEAGIPPIAQGPFFSIRKPAARVFTLEEYIEGGMLSRLYADAIIAGVKARENMLVIGGTGSGKTTLCNAVLQEMAVWTPDDRMGIIQDTNELQVPNKNKFLLRTSDEVGISRLLRVSMRMQPTRIVVGEVRGGEAQALLKAWNSGHPGGLCTIHADSAKQGLTKLVDYICEAPGMESRGTEHIARSVAQIIGIVIFIEKTSSVPSRKVSQVAKVAGYRDGDFVLNSIVGDIH